MDWIYLLNLVVILSMNPTPLNVGCLSTNSKQSTLRNVTLTRQQPEIELYLKRITPLIGIWGLCIVPGKKLIFQWGCFGGSEITTSRCLLCSGMMPAPYVRLMFQEMHSERCRKAVNKKRNFPPGERGDTEPSRYKGFTSPASHTGRLRLWSGIWPSDNHHSFTPETYDL